MTVRDARRRLVLLAALLLAVVLISLVAGAVPIAPAELLAIVANRAGLDLPIVVTPQQESVLLAIRLPRVALACLVGAALACAGAAMQGQSRSPLADPALLGIGAAAALGAAAGRLVAIRLGVPAGLIGTLLVALCAIAPAYVASVLIHRVSLSGGRVIVPVMLVAGVALSALLGAVTAFLVFASRDPGVGDVTFWTLGSLSGAGPDDILVVALVAVPAVVVLLRLAPGLDALALGERAAVHLGIDVRAQARLMIALVALLTAVAVSVAGSIAFLALVTPVLVRGVLGAGHRSVVAGSAVLGAALLVAADLGSRTLVSPVELPVGAVTAVVGAPLLLWLLVRDRRLVAG